MSKKKPAPESPDETPEPSRAAGACVLIALGGGALGAVWAASPEAGVLTLWGTGALAVWRYVRRAANPAPPPPPERGPDENPLFTVVEDERGRCTIQWREGVNGS
jgi:hypothetical protein